MWGASGRVVGPVTAGRVISFLNVQVNVQVFDVQASVAQSCHGAVFLIAEQGKQYQNRKRNGRSCMSVVTDVGKVGNLLSDG